MAPAVLAALIAGGSSLIGGGLSAFGQASTNKFNALAQQKLMEAQNRFNLEQWQRSNEYNTPANQRKRLEDAGINPALALSNITPGITQAVTSASGEGAPRAENALGALGQGVASSGAQIAAMAQQQQLVDLQAQQVEAQIAKTNAETEAIKTDTATLDDRNKADLENKKAQTGNLLFDLAKKEKILPVEMKKLQSEALEATNRADYIQVQTLMAEFERIHMQPAKLIELQTRVKSMVVTMAYTRAQTALTMAQKEMVYKSLLTETLKQGNLANEYVVGKVLRSFVGQKIQSEIRSNNSRSDYVEQETRLAPMDRVITLSGMLMQSMTSYMTSK